MAGNYAFTVTDSNSCQYVNQVNISQPTQIVFDNPSIQNVNCFNGNSGKITVSAIGGTGSISYTWSQDTTLHSATATGLAAGSYTVTATDSLHCTASVSYNVNQPPQLMFTSVVPVNVT